MEALGVPVEVILTEYKGVSCAHDTSIAMALRSILIVVIVVVVVARQGHATEIAREHGSIDCGLVVS